MHAGSQFHLDLLKLRSHAIAPRFALELERPAPRLAADEREPQEGEGLRFAKPSPLMSCRRMAAELQQSRLLPMKLKLELLEPHSHRVPEAPSIGFMLEARHDVIGIAHDDHVAGGFTPPPSLGPEIEDVVQVDVGEQRRCHCPLRSPLLTDAPVPAIYAGSLRIAQVSSPPRRSACGPLIKPRHTRSSSHLRPMCGASGPVARNRRGRRPASAVRTMRGQRSGYARRPSRKCDNAGINTTAPTMFQTNMNASRIPMSA